MQYKEHKKCNIRILSNTSNFKEREVVKGKNGRLTQSDTSSIAQNKCGRLWLGQTKDKFSALDFPSLRCTHLFAKYKVALFCSPRTQSLSHRAPNFVKITVTRPTKITQ